MYFHHSVRVGFHFRSRSRQEMQEELYFEAGKVPFHFFGVKLESLRACVQLTAKCFIKSSKSWKSIKFLKLCVVQCYYMYLTIFRQKAKYKIVRSPSVLGRGQKGCWRFYSILCATLTLCNLKLNILKLECNFKVKVRMLAFTQFYFILI